jgi:hypothetical protein
MNNYYKDIMQLVKVKSYSDNRDYNALLSAGNIAQIEKLKENDHKESFDNIPLWEAYYLLRDEIEELDFEIDNKNKDYSKIRHEAADVANFAHMIILKCDREINK